MSFLRNFLFYCLFLCAFSTSAFAQPEEDTLANFDFCGYTPRFADSIARAYYNANHGPNQLQGGPYIPAAIISCGRFDLYFDDINNASAFGFDDPQWGPARVQCACDVFSYIQQVVAIPTGDGTQIPIQFGASLNLNNGLLGQAAPMQNANNGVYWTGAPGIYAGDLFLHMTLGTDPAPAAVDLFDGFIQMNFFNPGFGVRICNDCALPHTSCCYDLQSVLLHEATHAMGFGSMIVEDNAQVPISFSTIAFNDPNALQFSRYDDIFLFSGPNLLSLTKVLGANQTIQTGAGSIRNNLVWMNDNNSYHNNQPVFSRTGFTTVGTNLSHYDENYSIGRAHEAPGFVPNYVMTPALSSWQIKREWTLQEVRLLQQLGFTISNSYSNFTLLPNRSPFVDGPVITAQITGGNSYADGLTGLNPSLVINANLNGPITCANPLVLDLGSRTELHDDNGNTFRIFPGSLRNIRGCGSGGNNHNQLTVQSGAGVNGSDIITYVPRTDFIGIAQFGFYLWDGIEKGAFVVYSVNVSAGPCFNNGVDLVINGSLEEGTEVALNINPNIDNDMLRNSNLLGNQTVIGLSLWGWHHADGCYFFGSSLGSTVDGTIEDSWGDCAFGSSGNSFNPGLRAFPSNGNNNTLPGDSRYAGFVSGETVGFQLATPMQSCTGYLLEFDMYVEQNPVNLPVNINVDFVNSIAGAPLFAIPFNATLSFNTPDWVHVTIPFTYGGPSSTTTIMRFTNNTGGFYTLFDNISLVVTNPNASPISVAPSTPLNPICVNQFATIFSNVSGGTGPYTYQWSNNSQTQDILVGLGSPAIVPYTVTVTDANGCSAQATLTLTVTPIPTVTVVAPQQTICSGHSATLTASGATTYNWNPGNLNGVSVLVTPSATTVYTVTGTTGCAATATATVNVNPSPTITLTGNPTTICNSGPSTLTASGASSYTWQPGNISGASIVVAPTTTTTYTVMGTASNGCTSTQTITINFSTISVSASASPNVIVASGSSTLSSNGASTYLWQPGNLTGASVTVSPTTTTTYTVTGTNSLGCTATATVTVTVLQPCTNCVNGTIPGMITSSASFTGTVCMNNDVIIDGPNTVVTFNNAFVKVIGFNGTNMRVHVRNGATLNIINSNIFSCNNDLWEGIYIDDAASQVITNGAMIEDAYHAIVSINGGKYTCINTRFNKNYKSIEVAPYAGNHPGTIRGCIFTAISTPITSGPGTTLKNPFAGRPPAVGVEISNVQNITVGFNGGSLAANLFTLIERGVHVTSKSNLTLINNDFRQIRYSTYCSPNNPCPNTGISVLVENTSTLTAGGSAALGNRFRNCDNGIHTRNDVTCDIQYNTFQLIDAAALYSSRCIYLATNTLQTITVNNNSFTDFRQGVEVQTYDKCFVYINNNDFKRFGNGQGVLCRQNNKSSLQIYTNLFNNNNPNDFGLTGISVGNAVITTNGTVDIQGNTIRNCSNGIEVTSINAPQITNQNNIRFKYNGPPAFTEYGIHITNCPKSLVDNNTVFRTGNQVPSAQYANLLVGIAVDMGCISSQISNNLVLRLATGLRFSGSNNLPLVVSCNQMSTNRIGMQLNSTNIGNQGSAAQAQDNQWQIPTNMLGAERTSGTPPTFYHRGTTQTPPWFPAPSQMNLPNAILPISINNSPFNCLLGCPNPPCQQNQVARIAQRQIPYNIPLTPLDRYFTVRSAYGEIMDNPAMMALGTTDDGIVVLLHDSLLLTNIGLMRTISDSLAAGDTLVPYQLYTSFTPTNTPEQNQKIVYEIYFRTWAEGTYEFDAQDYNTLLSIAQQYPDEGGTAVLDARVMIDYRQDDYFPSSGARHLQPEPEPDGLGIMYPNPATNEAYYDILLDDDDIGELELFNSFGQSIASYKLASGVNHVFLDFALLTSGIYHYRVSINGDAKLSEEIIIAK